jgi:Uma2 family endonuclease
VDVAVATVVGPFVRDLGLGECFGSSQGFDLPSGDTVAPDFSFVSAARWQRLPPPEHGRFLRVVPDLVVEILSPSTAARDRGDKKDVYERNGVREYWIIDPGARQLVVFAREGDRFGAGVTLAEGEGFASRVIRGLEFDVATVLRPSRPTPAS